MIYRPSTFLAFSWIAAMVFPGVPGFIISHGLELEMLVSVLAVAGSCLWVNRPVDALEAERRAFRVFLKSLEGEK